MNTPEHATTGHNAQPSTGYQSQRSTHVDPPTADHTWRDQFTEAETTFYNTLHKIETELNIALQNTLKQTNRRVVINVVNTKPSAKTTFDYTFPQVRGM